MTTLNILSITSSTLVTFFRRRFLKTFLLTIIFLLTANLVYSQKGRLEGFVNDYYSGDPLIGAYIIVDGTSKGTTADMDGLYSLKLDVGQYNIRYQFISYKDTVVSVTIKADEPTIVDMQLFPSVIMGQEIVVDAARLSKRVRELARLREKQERNLESYKADVYKLAILSSFEGSIKDTSSGKPVAYSERIGTMNFVKPNRYSETIKARRASENFFSEYDFFSTGGSPLDLNSNRVSLSILSEDITVVGPISVNARKFYDFEDKDAEGDWPAGTVELSIKPKVDNRPLFTGTVWINDEINSVLGIDVRLNKWADTNTGLFKVTDLRYQQSYKKVGEYWLPDITTLTGIVSVLGTKKQIFYKDVWTWTNHQINLSNLQVMDIPLSGEIIADDVDDKPKEYWANLPVRTENPNADLLEEAQSYSEERLVVKAGMGLMRAVFRLPYQMEKFYITNLNDVYRFNRVEGHYVGLGLRFPVHKDYDYRLIGGYATSEEEFRYRIKGLHYIPKTNFAPEFQVHKQIYQQYVDYEYNQTPIDFTETRQTLLALGLGIYNRNFFERDGHELGFRFRWGSESFFKVLYVDENQRRLETTTDFNLIGNKTDSLDLANNDVSFPAQSGRLRGFNIHFHHDTRKYMRYNFLRDYDVRDFGYVADIYYEQGMGDWGSDFDFKRYRAAINFNIPVFSSHFIQTQIITGAANGGTPHQRYFTLNGYILDDYIRERPFIAAPFKEPLGTRASIVRVRYRFGSSLTRKVPIEAIRKSGIRISTFVTAGIVDKDHSMQPLLPKPNSESQVEVGVAAARIFGLFYMEFSKRLVGQYGNSIGFVFLF